MKNVYPVLFTKTADGILVEVPDFKIVTEGKDEFDAIYMARDAIGVKGIYLEDKGESVPEPSCINKIDCENSEFSKDGKTYVSLVDIDFSDYRRRNDDKMVRRNVTLPNWMNVRAEDAGLNVSKVLQEALKTQLNHEENSSADPFYSESNMAHIQRGLDQLNAGKGVEHELIEIEDEEDLMSYSAKEEGGFVTESGIPFSVQLENPNQETKKAIEESRAGETEQVTDEEWDDLLHENIKE